MVQHHHAFALVEGFLLLTCILHFRWRWLRTVLRSGMIQWVGSISDLKVQYQKGTMLKKERRKFHCLGILSGIIHLNDVYCTFI